MNEIKKIIAQMSLAEKVGQLFQIGFAGTEVTDGIKEMIEKYKVGNIIYFARNIESPEQVRSMSGQLQEIAKATGPGLPLLISTDQEGGTVTRLKGVTHFPGNMALGAARSKELAREAGESVGREIKSLGINMNLAPVLDINNNPDNPVIGVRSFGEDPQLVAELGISFITGMQGQGVVACGKHFPGHGDTNIDSHLALPVIKHGWARLDKVELYPFKKAIEAGLDSIMTAHVYFPTIEKKEGIPATLSSSVLTGLLRQKLGFEGLIITDCMEMNAIVSTFGTVTGAVMTIEAGSDMVLVSHSLDQAQLAVKAVIDAVENGRIAEKRLDQSLGRILSLKAKRLGLGVDQSPGTSELNFASGEGVAYRIAKKAVSLVKNDQKILPLKREAKQVLVCDFKMGMLALVENEQNHKNRLVDYLEKGGLAVDYHTFNADNPKLPGSDHYDLVIVCTYNAANQPAQVEIINALQKRKSPLLVLALRNPYDLMVIPGISTFMTTYDLSPANLRVASEIILGSLIPAGTLPVTI